jgi:hypothetical protein
MWSSSSRGGVEESWHSAIPKTTPGFAANTPFWTVDLYAGRSRTITAIDAPGSLHAVARLLEWEWDERLDSPGS